MDHLARGAGIDSGATLPGEMFDAHEILTMQDQSKVHRFTLHDARALNGRILYAARWQHEAASWWPGGGGVIRSIVGCFHSREKPSALMAAAACGTTGC